MSGRYNRSGNIRDNVERSSMGTLFERLLADEEDIDVSREKDEVISCVKSIKKHLRTLLNSRQGSSASAPFHGVSDFNDGAVDSNDMVKHIAASIQACIENFEPRVSHVVVEHQAQSDRPLDLHFRIRADLAANTRDEQICIDVQMNDARDARIY